MTRVLIVDDHALFRIGLEMLLAQLAPSAQIAQAANAREATKLLTHTPFELVLLDWHMPEIAGIQALATLREAAAGARIVVLSGEQNPALIRACIDEGAAGFIPKNSSTEQLTAALQVIATGGIYLPSMAQFSMGEPGRGLPSNSMVEVAQCLPELTPRQCDVLRAMARGLPNKLIARELGISDDTVKQHLTAVYQVLEVRNRTEAVYAISQRGLRIA